MATETVVLNEEQLRELARLIYYREAEATQNIHFQSEFEQAKYLGICLSNYETVLGLLDRGRDLLRRFEGDDAREPIARGILDYTVGCTNSALQTVRNYTLRADYLAKIGDHVKELERELEGLDPADGSRVVLLRQEAVGYRDAVLEYTRKYRSSASRDFSDMIKQSGEKFDALVQRYTDKLGFPMTFSELDKGQKIQVYDEIQEASGRGAVVAKHIKNIRGVGGPAVLLFNAGLMVWDIFSSQHGPNKAAHDAANEVALVGGAMLSAIVESILATALEGAVEATELFVVMAGVAASFLGDFVIGVTLGLVVDMVFFSGGKKHGIDETQGHRCYITPLPDGAEMARELVHP